MAVKVTKKRKGGERRRNTIRFSLSSSFLRASFEPASVAASYGLLRLSRGAFASFSLRFSVFSSSALYFVPFFISF